jgi:hypothetical protein
MRVTGSIGTPSAFASKNSELGLTGFCANALSDQTVIRAIPANLAAVHVTFIRMTLL